MVGAKPIHRVLHKLHGWSRIKQEFVGARLNDVGLRLGQDFRCAD